MAEESLLSGSDNHFTVQVGAVHLVIFFTLLHTLVINVYAGGVKLLAEESLL